MRKISLLPTFLLATTIAGCNISLNDSLTGKKLYYTYVKNITIYGVTVPYSVEELEFDFTTDSEVQILPTVIYGVNASDSSLYDKKLKFNYTFKDHDLTISQMNTPAVKLTENDNFYVTSAGETYYKQSILDLSTQLQKDRFIKELHSDKLDDKMFLKRIIFRR